MKALRLISLLLVGVLVLAACGSDDDDTAEDGTDVTEAAGDDGSDDGDGDDTDDGDDGDQGADVPTVTLTTSDGGSYTLDVTQCDNPAESDVVLMAESETERIVVDVQGGTGVITSEGAEGERSGTVLTGQVGDAGNIMISGQITPAGGTDETETFELTGSCA